MEGLLALLLLIGLLAILDVGSLRWGADSRDAIGDDHARSPYDSPRAAL